MQYLNAVTASVQTPDREADGPQPTSLSPCHPHHQAGQIKIIGNESKQKCEALSESIKFLSPSENALDQLIAFCSTPQ